MSKIFGILKILAREKFLKKKKKVFRAKRRQIGSLDHEKDSREEKVDRMQDNFEVLTNFNFDHVGLDPWTVAMCVGRGHAKIFAKSALLMLIFRENCSETRGLVSGHHVDHASL